MLFEYHELSTHTNIYLSICNNGSFFASIKQQYKNFSWTLTTLPHTILFY